jgi:hypothetical protein
MKSVDIHPSVILRVINSHGLGAPVGSLARVKSVETAPSGDWLCIVEYQHKKPPKHGTRLYRSHLWASDLGRFDIVTDHNAASHQRKTMAGTVSKRLQLRLPFDEQLPP